MSEIDNLNQDEETKLTGLEIAVIGMAGRFPGAQDLDKFWENIKTGVEKVSHFSDQELLEYGVDPGLLKDPNYVKAKGVLEGIELFDAHFFGFNNSEARLMDPQIRMMFECTWHALEDAGCDPDVYSGTIGFYVGAATDANWLAQSVLPRGMDNLDLFDNVMYGHKDLLSTLVSYRLNLKGPSYSLYTACSTSLAAIHMGCRALLTGECRVAMAGGVTVTLPKKFGYLCKEGMIYSPDGHCRPFDANACGTLFGDGVGLVVLKRFEDALEDGDRIHAVIKSSAANNDGRRKVGYVAPSVEGQADVIKAALYMAEVKPESIGFVECHGTGTLVGDPIEIEALTKAFNTDKKNFCAVGSIKADVGHLHAAAGVAGFIKAVLVLKNKFLPPAVNYEAPNPKIDFPNSPFYVNTKSREWKNNGSPLRAGVSSFGIGGTNVHIILEQAPEPPQGNENDRLSPASTRPHRLILLSAKTEVSLALASENLANYLKCTPHLNLDDAAYTLQAGRRAFQHRRMIVCSDTRELIEKLAVNENITAVQMENNPVIFMFSGQGSQYVNMGLELYRAEKTFRDDIDQGFHELAPIMGENCRYVLYPYPDKSKSGDLSDLEKEKINEFIYTSPVKFIFEYALARLIMSWGIKPEAIIGHSFGEYTAACLAGVFSFTDALKLSAMRGQLFHELPEGMMVSVSMPEDRLREILKEQGAADKVAVAAVNGVSQCLISGPCDLTAQIQAQLEAAGCECARVRVPRAGHSQEMKPIVARFRQTLEQVSFNKPSIPYISGLSGKWIKDEEAADPSYYCRHLLETIRFSDGLSELLKKENAVFIQFGSDRSLNSFLNQHPGKKPGHIVLDLIRHPKDEVADTRFLMEKIGQLWLNGVKPDWKSFYAGQQRPIISLPGYAFEPVPYLSKAFYSAKIENRVEKRGQANIGGKEENENIPSDLQVSALAFKRPELKSKFELPRTAAEQAIAEIWQAVFGVQQVGICDNFFELGGDSLIALNTISKINKKLDTNIPVSQLFVHPTIAEFAVLIETNESPIHKIKYPEKKPDLENLYVPFSLTDIQLSYLVGRHGSFEMGGISTHAYQEIETQLNISQLNQGLNQLIRRHPMLRTIFIGGNQQVILKEIPVYTIHVEDLCHLGAGAQQERIKRERERMAHFIFAPHQWPLFEIKGFKLSQDTHYLCIGLDMLISDGASIGILVKDLLTYYEGKDNDVPVLEFTFRDYILAYEELKAGEIYRADKEHWLSKLEEFPLSPALPLKCNPANIVHPRFKRHREIFPAAAWEKLKTAARRKNITPSALLSTAYADVLSYWSNQPRMAFNLTVFNRYPFHEDVNKIIGDFTSVILLGIDFSQCTHDAPDTGFWAKAAVVQRALFEALEHRHYDGVEFIRELARYHGMTGKAVMPIIFTSAIFSGETVALTDMNRLGDLKEGISQTP
ncbi:MAG: condensation domain-containing protein, partial [Acidobacteria bacterium]|nr:condensation domain-containing protein [Acidobacteriota bacterium]